MNKKSSDIPAPKSNPYPFWAPRFWHGMTFHAWTTLLRRNRWQISPHRLPMAATVFLNTLFNSTSAALQNKLWCERIAQTPLEPPIFILGFWRSGTTLLHELLFLDERFVTPNTYECFAPEHFFLSERWVSKLKFLLPRQRPMDNMPAGWERPQEDEFALCAMGAVSPYESMAFPRNSDEHYKYLNLDISAEEQEFWKEKLLFFMRAVTLQRILQNQKDHKKQTPSARLVLKSPTHTARLQLLATLFPDAKFIHLTREPATLFASNRRLRHSLHETQSLQTFDKAHFDEIIFRCHEVMYNGWKECAASLPANRLIEMRYEDLVGEPMSALSKIYNQLELGDYELVKLRFENYFEEAHSYQPNRHQLSEEESMMVYERWASYAARYGYNRTNSQ